MAQAMVNFRMDAELKRAMEETFRQMGLTMADAFTVFAVKVMQEQRIPSILKQNRANLIPEIKKGLLHETNVQQPQILWRIVKSSATFSYRKLHREYDTRGIYVDACSAHQKPLGCDLPKYP